MYPLTLIYQSIIRYIQLTAKVLVLFRLFSDGRLGNPDLTWEKQKQINIGFDASFYKNRVTLSGDYFQTKNTDLLMQMALSPTTGFTNKIANVGELKNKGLEFSLTLVPVQTDDFTWTVNANISHDKNEVTKLYNGLQVIWSGNSITSRENNLFVGEPLNTFYSYRLRKLPSRRYGPHQCYEF